MNSRQEAEKRAEKLNQGSPGPAGKQKSWQTAAHDGVRGSLPTFFYVTQEFACDMVSAIKRTLFYDNRGISLILN